MIDLESNRRSWLLAMRYTRCVIPEAGFLSNLLLPVLYYGFLSVQQMLNIGAKFSSDLMTLWPLLSVVVTLYIG